MTPPPDRHHDDDDDQPKIPRPRDVGRPFDPAPTRERNRTILAIGSFSLFALVVLSFAAATLFFGRAWSEIAPAASGLLPAVSAVTAGAITFFFTNERKDGR